MHKHSHPKISDDESEQYLSVFKFSKQKSEQRLKLWQSLFEKYSDEFPNDEELFIERLDDEFNTNSTKRLPERIASNLIQHWVDTGEAPHKLCLNANNLSQETVVSLNESEALSFRHEHSPNTSLHVSKFDNSINCTSKAKQNDFLNNTTNNTKSPIKELNNKMKTSDISDQSIIIKNCKTSENNDVDKAGSETGKSSEALFDLPCKKYETLDDLMYKLPKDSDIIQNQLVHVDNDDINKSSSFMNSQFSNASKSLRRRKLYKGRDSPIDLLEPTNTFMQESSVFQDSRCSILSVSNWSKKSRSNILKHHHLLLQDERRSKLSLRMSNYKTAVLKSSINNDNNKNKQETLNENLENDKICSFPNMTDQHDVQKEKETTSLKKSLDQMPVSQKTGSNKSSLTVSVKSNILEKKTASPLENLKNGVKCSSISSSDTEICSEPIKDITGTTTDSDQSTIFIQECDLKSTDLKTRNTSDLKVDHKSKIILKEPQIKLQRNFVENYLRDQKLKEERRIEYSKTVENRINVCEPQQFENFIKPCNGIKHYQTKSNNSVTPNITVKNTKKHFAHLEFSCSEEDEFIKIWRKYKKYKSKSEYNLKQTRSANKLSDQMSVNNKFDTILQKNSCANDSRKNYTYFEKCNNFTTKIVDFVSNKAEQNTTQNYDTEDNLLPCQRSDFVPLSSDSSDEEVSSIIGSKLDKNGKRVSELSTNRRKILTLKKIHKGIKGTGSEWGTDDQDNVSLSKVPLKSEETSTNHKSKLLTSKKKSPIADSKLNTFSEKAAIDGAILSAKESTIRKDDLIMWKIKNTEHISINLMHKFNAKENSNDNSTLSPVLKRQRISKKSEKSFSLIKHLNNSETKEKNSNNILLGINNSDYYDTMLNIDTTLKIPLENRITKDKRYLTDTQLTENANVDKKIFRWYTRDI